MKIIIENWKNEKNKKHKENEKNKINEQVGWNDPIFKDILPILNRVHSIPKVQSYTYLKQLIDPRLASYKSGGLYDWHADQHRKPVKGLVRKISMTLFMSDPEEYEGGEFDLELFSPEYKSRFKTFKLKKGEAIFFKSDAWHRVRPVSNGVRKSIVAWYFGPTFK